MAAPTAENVFVPSVKSIPHGDVFASLSSRGEVSGEGPTPASSEANAAGYVATELQTPRGAGAARGSSGVLHLFAVVYHLDCSFQEQRVTEITHKESIVCFQRRPLWIRNEIPHAHRRTQASILIDDAHKISVCLGWLDSIESADGRTRWQLAMMSVGRIESISVIEPHLDPYKLRGPPIRIRSSHALISSFRDVTGLRAVGGKPFNVERCVRQGPAAHSALPLHIFFG